MSELEEDILDTFNAFEAAIVNFKQRRAKKHGVRNEKIEVDKQATEEPLEYNLEKIPWIQAEGKKGIYQKYPAFKQKPSMTVDYINLLEDLKQHNGKLTRNGFFMWLFDDNVTVARKPAKR